MMEAAGDGGQRKTTPTAAAISAPISEAVTAAAAAAGKKVLRPVSGKGVKGSDGAGTGAPIIVRPGIPRD